MTIKKMIIIDKKMKTKKETPKNDFNVTIGNTVLCDGFLIPMTDFVIEIDENKPKFKNFSSFSEINQYEINGYDKIRNYATFLKQPLKLEMFVPCDEDGNVLGEPKVDEHTTQIFAQYQYDLDKAKEKVLFEGFKIYDYKLNVFFYLSRRRTLSYDKKRKDFITIGLLPETVEDLINVSSQIKLTQTALNAIFG